MSNNLKNKPHLQKDGELRRKSYSADSKAQVIPIFNTLLKLPQFQALTRIQNSQNQNRLRLIDILNNTVSGMFSWMDILKMQISLHYEIMPIQAISPLRSINSSQSLQSQERSQASFISFTPETTIQTHSIQTAMNLINLQLTKYFYIPEFYGWNWLTLILGKVYSQEELLSLALDPTIISAKIKQIHHSLFKTTFYPNVTNNPNYKDKAYPLLLILYESSSSSEKEKELLFKKILNQIILLRLYEAQYTRANMNITESKKQRNEIKSEAKKQNSNGPNLNKQRPIQFYLIISKIKTLSKLFSKLGSFYVNLLRLISQDFNVIFYVLPTQKNFEFKDFLLFYSQEINTQNEQFSQDKVENTFKKRNKEEGIHEIQIQAKRNNQLQQKNIKNQARTNNSNISSPIQKKNQLVKIDANFEEKHNIRDRLSFNSNQQMVDQSEQNSLYSNFEIQKQDIFNKVASNYFKQTSLNKNKIEIQKAFKKNKEDQKYPPQSIVKYSQLKNQKFHNENENVEKYNMEMMEQDKEKQIKNKSSIEREFLDIIFMKKSLENKKFYQKYDDLNFSDEQKQSIDIVINLSNKQLKKLSKPTKEDCQPQDSKQTKFEDKGFDGKGNIDNQMKG